MARKAVTSVLLALCTAIGLLIGGGGAAPAMASNCQKTDTPAIDQALEDFDASAFCLINEQRAAHGRSALRPNGQLRRAAYDYAPSIELGGFFSRYGDFFGHPAGATPNSRLRRIGYIRRHNVWIVGENLHWTTADRSTPADVSEAWMSSPEHRKYLLKRRFRNSAAPPSAVFPPTPPRPTGSPWPPSSDSVIHDAVQEILRAPAWPFRTLQGVHFSRTERAWPARPPGYTLASPSPTEPEVKSKDRQPGADTDWTPGESASPDPYGLTESQPTDRNVRPTELLDRPPKD